MKRALVVVAVAIFSAVQFSCNAKGNSITKPEMKTPVEKYSYMIGMDIGNSLKELNAPLDTNAIFYGMLDILKGRAPLLTEADLNQVKQDFGKMMQEKQMSRMKEASDKNGKEGQAFLDDNKKKPGVITTASGLQYTVITEGKGPMPKATDKVKVNYEGTLIDGKIFDSSIKRGQPAEFPVNGVIPGWTEALQLMKVGSKFKVFVPSNLAYGERGAGRDIGPNATLIFEVELLSIENGAPASQGAIPAQPKLQIKPQVKAQTK